MIAPERITLSDMLKTAINNLADHSEHVLDLHGSPAERTSTLWLNRHTVPIPYGQVITLDPEADATELQSQVESFIRSRPEGSPAAVTDSFSNLDLTAAGKKVLFSDPWFFREPGPCEPRTPGELEIVTVETAAQVTEFNRAEALGFGGERKVDPYLAPIIEDRRHRLLIGRVDGEPVCSVLTFNNGDSVGVYALSTVPGSRQKGYGEAIVRAALSEIDNLPAFTNPSSMSNGLFRRMGFREIGRRTIWI